jgi:hypothetical protein
MSSRARTVASFALLALLAAVLFWRLDAPHDIDDAPITYRYAENIAAGHGYVYNLGERIQGASTPLYALLLAAPGVVGVPVPAASNVINLLASTATVLLAALLARRLTGSLLAGLLAGASLLTLGPFLRWTTSGMETPLYMALILGTFSALAYDRDLLAACLAGLTVFTRLDGLAAAAALFPALLLRRRAIPWRAGLIFALTAAPWFVFSYAYFGSLFPHSMTAKQGHAASLGTDPSWMLFRFAGPEPLTPHALLGLALAGIVAVFNAGAEQPGDAADSARPARRATLLALLLWFALYLAAYTAVRIDYYEWYMAPLYPVLAIFVGAGLHAFIGLLAPRAAPGAPAWRGPAAQGLLAALALTGLFWLPASQEAEQQELTNDYIARVEGSRVRAAGWLRDHAAPDASLYTGFIGHVGYGHTLYVYDGAGLVTQGGRADFDNPEIDYYVLHDAAPTWRRCRIAAAWDTGASGPLPKQTILSACDGDAALASFGPFTFGGARLTASGQEYDAESWKATEEVMLETQWLVDESPTGEWTIYVHFTDDAGNTLAQADHVLGRTMFGDIRPPSGWDPGRRHYVYAALPENWDEIASEVSAARIGLWNPASGEHLPPVPAPDDANATEPPLTVDGAGRLVVPLTADKMTG